MVSAGGVAVANPLSAQLLTALGSKGVADVKRVSAAVALADQANGLWLEPPGVWEQAGQVQELQEALSDSQAALQRERHRAQLLEQELEWLMAQHCPQNDHSATHAAAAVPQLQNGHTSGWVSISEAEYELLRLKERALDAVREGITIADCSLPDLPIMYANDGFARLTGYSVAETVGQNCRFLQGEGTDPRMVAELRAAIKGGRPCVVQLMNYKRNGDPFCNYLSITPVHDGQGHLTHFVGVQSDITEMIVHQRGELAAKHLAAQAAAATEAKSQFLARMSHEIRTPLNGMIAVGQLLAETPLSSGQWDLVNTIRCSGEALLTLISDILDFSRIEANKMILNNSEFRLASVVEAAMEIAGLHAAQKRLQVAYNISPGVPAAIVGDKQRLQQILLNVLNNAVKFTEAGEILLEVWCEEGVSSRRAAGAGGFEACSSASSSPAINSELHADSFQRHMAELSKRRSISGTTEGQSLPCRQSMDDVSTSGRETPTSPSRAGAPPYVIRFAVRDTGIGIAPKDLTRLFQSFSQVDASPTRRYGGSGLGLTISQKLSEAMGGRMWAESGGLGKGCTFQWTIACQTPSGTPRRQRSLTGSTATADGCGYDSNCSTPSARSSAVPFVPPLALPPALREAAEEAALLAGKRMLLVEPCGMVRQVLALALRSWGCAVAAVASEAAAIQRLRLKGSYRAPKADGTLPAEAPRGCLSLQHSVPVEEEGVGEAAGPYDVVLLDMRLGHLLQALLKYAADAEAQRVVFMGWPGQKDPEDEGGIEAESPVSSAASSAFEAGPLDLAAPQPPKMLADGDGRELGYVIVTRPVRQGRLRLALQEVLTMQMHSPHNDADAVDGSQADQPAHVNIDKYVNGIPRVASGGQLKRAHQIKMHGSGSTPDLSDIAPSKRILLAEDNAINMKVALGILHRIGCTDVVVATDGEAALRELEQREGGANAFDIILMDLHMPRMGGMEAVSHIRRRWPEAACTIVAVTADAFEDTRDDCLASGFDGWLPKPFRVEDVVQILIGPPSDAATGRQQGGDGSGK